MITLGGGGVSFDVSYTVSFDPSVVWASLIVPFVPVRLLGEGIID